MLGFAADNASVMICSMGGLKAKLLEKIPHLFVIGCICHFKFMFICCMSVEELCRDIHAYINNSPKRLLKFQEFQEFVNVDSHRLTYASPTRWLSLESVVNRMLEQWSALILFFQAEALESNIKSAAGILNALTNPIYKLYFSFPGYILPIINKINREFQSENVVIHTAYSNISAFYRTILSNFIKRHVIKAESDPFSAKFQNPSNFLPESDWNFGSKVESMFNDENVKEELKSEISNFRVHCLNFDVELSEQISKRFKGLSDIFPLLKACDPAVARVTGMKSFVPLFTKFPQLINESEYDQVHDEWRSLTFHEVLSTSENPAEFWCSVKKIKSSDGSLVFPKLANFMLSLLVLPHSSAAVDAQNERGERLTSCFTFEINSSRCKDNCTLSRIH